MGLGLGLAFRLGLGLGLRPSAVLMTLIPLTLTLTRLGARPERALLLAHLFRSYRPCSVVTTPVPWQALGLSVHSFFFVPLLLDIVVQSRLLQKVIEALILSLTLTLTLSLALTLALTLTRSSRR